MGWTTVGGPVPEKKAIILGVPHTSIMDFVVSYLFYTQFDAGKAKVMIKKEFFFWPLGPMLRKMGAIPTDRSNATAMVKGLIDEMEKDDTFILAIAPEGTRKPVKKWKTGYHTIAKAVDCPVYLGFNFNSGGYYGPELKSGTLVITDAGNGDIIVNIDAVDQNNEKFVLSAVFQGESY